jgi:hypothetical protein
MTEEARRLEEAREGLLAVFLSRLTGSWSRSTTVFWPAREGRRHEMVSDSCSTPGPPGGHDLAQRGLFLDVPGWVHHVFEVSLTP